jgi:ribulose-phosphate 3-epimerase
VEDPAKVVETLQEIRALGAKAGLSIKPATPASALFPYLEWLDMVMVMTVEPGFGNQKMMPECLAKVQELRAEANRRGQELLLAIDGGMNVSTKEMVWAAGVDMAVAGSAVFGAPDAADMIRVLSGK